jgi:hypothetical protein
MSRDAIDVPDVACGGVRFECARAACRVNNSDFALPSHVITTTPIDDFLKPLRK